ARSRGTTRDTARDREGAAAGRRSPARLAASDRPRDRGSAARRRAAYDVRQLQKEQRQRRTVMRAAIARTLTALPTLLRIGVAETVAYRAEFVVWMLTSTMPLVNL